MIGRNIFTNPKNHITLPPNAECSAARCKSMKSFYFIHNTGGTQNPIPQYEKWVTLLTFAVFENHLEVFCFWFGFLANDIGWTWILSPYGQIKLHEINTKRLDRILNFIYTYIEDCSVILKPFRDTIRIQPTSSSPWGNGRVREKSISSLYVGPHTSQKRNRRKKKKTLKMFT